jgi:predicted ATPase
MPDPSDERHGSDLTRATPRGERRSGTRRVGPYRIDGELGRGGMGVVFRAFDERLQRDVALKALPAALAADPVERARLEREARAIAFVSHPNVAMIHGLEESDGALYLVLELVAGETLRERMTRGAMAVDEALAVCGDVAAGLAAVHRKGLVHRDLKPSNVMVTIDGTAKLLDFGLARRAREEGRGEITRRGEVLGTPGFMSPEQLRGDPLDPRSDAWAWGCLLYECLAGAPAFPGETATDRDAATLRDEPDWALLPEGTPDAARALVQECLSKDRAARPASIDTARQALEDARLTSGRRRVAAAPLPQHALPAARDAFVGREAELAELGRLLDEGHRLVSVLGLGGTGKTRLVMQHARASLPRFPGGAWFCDLSGARSVEGIVSAVATALDVPLGKDDLVQQLGHAIATRGRCLVILDNFEQVTRHAGETLGRWLDRAGEATFVVTTREVLGLPGEEHVALQPLPQQDAEELFVVRARTAQHGFAPDEDERRDVATLVEELDHLPLAIELAAARTRVMPVKQLLARMTERFKLLAGSGSRRDRQSTLRATFDWSWELLSDDERSALAQLSVFAGGFTLEAAEAVLALENLWPADAVHALLDKSWVRKSADGRFDLLASVQEYAAEKLAALGAAAAAEQRHGAWFAALGSDEARDALHHHGGFERLRALGLELDNLVVACRRAILRRDAATATDALAAAWEVLLLRGPFALAADLAAEALGLSLTPAQRANVERIRARALHLVGRSPESLACLEAALATARDASERRLEGTLLADIGLLHLRFGRMKEARACLDAALAITREVRASFLEGQTLFVLGTLHRNQGRMEEARACYESALGIARALGDRRSEGYWCGSLAIVHQEQGRLDDARACLDGALPVLRELGDRNSQAQLLTTEGHIHKMQGRLDEARASYEAALAIDRQLGNRIGEGTQLGNLGIVHAARGHLDDAHACYRAALVIVREAGDRRAEGVNLGNMGDALLKQGRRDEARACAEEALRIHDEVGFRRGRGYWLKLLASIALAERRLDEAVALAGRAAEAARGYPDLEVEALATLCTMRLEAKDFAGAREALALAEGLGGVGIIRLMILQARACVLATERDVDGMRATLTEAETLAEQIDGGPDGAQARSVAQLRAEIEAAAS